MTKFKIFKGTNGQYYYNLQAPNGEKILSGEGYTTEQSCRIGIASVRTNAAYDFRYTKATALNGQFYFVLKAANGETIGRSEMYVTANGRDQGIEAVKRYAPTAIVEEVAARAY